MYGIGMWPCEGSRSAMKTRVLFLYFILGSIIASVWPFTIFKERHGIISGTISGRRPFTIDDSPFTIFNFRLSSIGKIFSFKKLAFSLSLGCAAHFQCLSLLQ